MTELMNATNSSFLAIGFFGSVAMLGWALAAGIPLLLHLRNRRRFQRTDWAAMDFLLAASQETSRRLRMEQWLLLLIRVAIPCLFALALADPRWPMTSDTGTATGAHISQHHLFLIDTSLSMEVRSGRESRFLQAKQFVEDTLKQSPTGDAYSLYLLSQPSQSVIARPVYQKDVVAEELKQLQCTHQVANLASGLRIAVRAVREAQESEPRLKSTRLYIISDLGANTWNANTLSDSKQFIEQLEALAEIVLVDVGTDVRTNRAVVAASRSSALPVIGNSIRWMVAILNASGDERSCPVEMRVDGKLLKKQPVSFLAGEASTSFTHRFDRPGPHAVSFHLPADDLDADNHRYDVVVMREMLNVLCVTGGTGTAEDLALALNPDEESSVRVQIEPAHSLGRRRLSEFDAIFLCNVSEVTRQHARDLRNYVASGGGLVVFLGDRCSAENYNSLLGGAMQSGPALLPAQLDSTVPYGRYRIDPKEYSHPLVRLFRGQDESGLLSTPIWRYVRLASPSDTAQVALAFQNGHPLVIEHTVWGAKVVMVATAPSSEARASAGDESPPWNAWSLWPSFPPVVQELLRFIVQAGDGQLNVNVGQPLTAAVDEDETSVRLRGPDGVIRFAEVNRAVTQRAVWNYVDTRYAGFYQLVDVDDDSDATLFAANLEDYLESSSDRLAVSELPPQLRRNAIGSETSGMDGNAERFSDSSVTGASSGANWILGMLLVLLIIESMVAWRMGNAR